MGLEKLMAKLNEVANQDGVVSDDEAQLMKTVKGFIEQYQNYKTITQEDGVIDEEERKKLKEMRKWILEGAWVEAQEDGFISKEESELIATIYDHLKTVEL